MSANGDRSLVCRGIRGATTASANTAEDIVEATQELVQALIALNDITADDIASAIFTTTPDLTATFPATAARHFGWTDVPMICTHEMAVPGALTRAVRVLVNVNTTRSPREIRHVYLKGAKALRPEWGVTDAELADATRGPSDPSNNRTDRTGPAVEPAAVSGSVPVAAPLATDR